LRFGGSAGSERIILAAMTAIQSHLKALDET
jgi:hypothetical protein